ncbi:hypothetical protein DW219_09520 [Desulfovibrio sp. AM18-2]|nr:hypothetical protein DW219_09520 [Desulfovibrio sp. AM18-2]CAI3232323.1 hypothetical protein DWUX_1267 [Desulfovibrio diazotrophicus]
MQVNFSGEELDAFRVFFYVQRSPERLGRRGCRPLGAAGVAVWACVPGKGCAERTWRLFGKNPASDWGGGKKIWTCPTATLVAYL